MSRKRLHNEPLRRPAKRSIEQITDEPVLRRLLRLNGAVKMGSPLLRSGNKALVRHNLQELEDRGIDHRAASIHLLENVPYGAGTTLPEHPQDAQLGVSRFWIRVFWFHTSVILRIRGSAASVFFEECPTLPRTEVDLGWRPGYYLRNRSYVLYTKDFVVVKG